MTQLQSHLPDEGVTPGIPTVTTLSNSVAHGCDEKVWVQALKQQCTAEVEAVRVELQHKQRQAARLLKARSEEEAIKVASTNPT